MITSSSYKNGYWETVRRKVRKMKVAGIEFVEYGKGRQIKKVEKPSLYFMNIKCCIFNINFITKKTLFIIIKIKDFLFIQLLEGGVVIVTVIVRRLRNKSYRKKWILWAHKYWMQHNCPSAGSFNLLVDLLSLLNI